MRNKKVLLITEANQQVASGHLMESIELSSILTRNGYEVDLFINGDACDAFKQRIKTKYYEYSINVESDIKKFLGILKKIDYRIVVTDLREVTNEWIKRIRPFTDARIICIDEWGHRELSCDIIINPMVDPYFWQYGITEAKIYSGHEYLILPERIQEYHLKDRIVSKQVRQVCISMGGVDKYGSTLKLLKWLKNLKPSISIDVVIGGGFAFKDELNSVIEEPNNVTIWQNIDNIYSILEKADFAFCAGGNTLHECACIGTPAVVIPTMDHEYLNGKFFEKQGFGITLSKSETVEDSEFDRAWSIMSDYDIRYNMFICGKRLCTGEGGKRVANIIEKMTVL